MNSEQRLSVDGVLDSREPVAEVPAREWSEREAASMLRMMMLRAVCCLLLFAVVLPVWAEFPAVFEEQLTPAQTALVEATRMPAGNVRDEQVAIALGSGFGENDRDLQLSFRWFVITYGQRLGLAGQRDLIARYRATYPDPRVVDGLTAEFAWEALSRDQRSVAYREALEKGSAESDTGLTISRLRAVRSVALEGISELRPRMEDAWSRLSERERASLPSIEALRVILTLSADAKGGTPGASRGSASPPQSDWLAAEALARMDGRAVTDRMGEEAGFREAVTLLVKWACARPQPWLPESSGCEQMKGVVRLQEKLAAENGTAPPK